MTIEEKLLIKILSLYSFATSTASVFLSLFLFKLGGFRNVAEFYVFYLLFIVVAYITSGWSLKKISSSQGIQLGLLLYSLCYFLLVLLQNNAAHAIPLLGMIFGFSSGTFWSGNNLSQYILTHEKSRNEYFGKLSSFTSLVSVGGPILGGWIISFFTSFHLPTVGYLSVFGIVGILLLVTAFLSSQLPYHSQVEFSPKDFFKQADRKWFGVLSQQFVFGLYDTAFATLSGIVVFLLVKNELRVGIINAVCALMYSFVSFYVAKMLSKYKKSYIFGMIGVSAGLFLFGYFHNLMSLGILILTIYGLSPFVGTPTSKAMLDVIDEAEGTWQNKYHFLIERDTFLGIGRTLSYAILLFFLSTHNSLEIITTWIMGIAIIPTIIAGIQYAFLRE